MVAGSWAREVYCNNLAMSVPDRSLELWPLAGNLLDECPNAIVEATEFWKEISARFDEPFYRENSPAELKAEFLVAQVAQMQFFERATKNLITLRQVLEQGRIANQTAVTLDETLKNASRTIALKVLSMPIEEHQALLKDFETLPTERRAILVNASAVIVAVTAPWIFIRDAFAVYLNKPTLGANAFALFVTVVKEGGLHLLGEVIPFIGSIVALAEALKKQEEEGWPNFMTYIDQRAAHLNLEKAVNQGLQDLNATDQAIREYSESIERTNRPFIERAGRVVAFLRTDSTLPLS
jgi:hypothetical protein